MQRRAWGEIRRADLKWDIFQFLDEDNQADVASINVGEARIAFPLATIANDRNSCSIFINDGNWFIHHLNVT